jgi:hypothetical protein
MIKTKDMKPTKIIITISIISIFGTAYSQSTNDFRKLGPIDYTKLTPLQKKVYNHFRSPKWTFNSMNDLVELYWDNGKVKRDYSKENAEIEKFLTKDEIEKLKKENGMFFENLKYTKLSPEQQKVFNYFWNKKEWTYDKLNSLKPLEVKSHLGKAGIDISNGNKVKTSYSFFKDLKVLVHGIETVENFEKTLKY